MRLHSSKQKLGAAASQGSQTFALEVHLLFSNWREHIQSTSKCPRGSWLLFMGQVYGENPLGQILRISAHWHWVQRQWVFSVTELSLDLKAQTSDKNQVTRAFAASGNQNSDFAKTMKAKYVETRLFVHFGCRRIWSSLVVEQVLLESLEYSTSCNTQLCHFRLDSRRIWQIWAKCLWFQTTGGPLGSWLCTSWGMVSQKSLFISFPFVRKVSFWMVYQKSPFKESFQGNKEM